MEITGGCVCGGTRYVLKSRPFALIDCHCIDCRRSADAPYVTWGSVPREDLVVTRGEPRKIAHADRIRSFCCVLRHAFVFRGHQGFRHDGRDDRVTPQRDAVCATERGLIRRQLAVGYDLRVVSSLPEDPKDRLTD